MRVEEGMWSHFVLRSAAHHEVLDVSKEVSKVDMEEVSTSGHHDVVIVTITNALGSEREREMKEEREEEGRGEHVPLTST